MRRGLVGLEGAQGHCPRVPNQQEGPLPPGSLFSQLLGQNLSWGWGMGEEWRHTGHGDLHRPVLGPTASGLPHLHTSLLHPQHLGKACPGNELAWSDGTPLHPSPISFCPPALSTLRDIQSFL